MQIEKEETHSHCSHDRDSLNCSVVLERFDEQDYRKLIPANKVGDSLSGMNLPDCSVSIEKLTDYGDNDVTKIAVDKEFIIMEYIELTVINSENVEPKITSIVTICRRPDDSSSAMYTPDKNCKLFTIGYKFDSLAGGPSGGLNFL